MRSTRLTAVHHALGGLILALLLVNIVAPYIGLKWEYSLTMFSNMETDMSDHFFMPSSNLCGNFEYYVVERLEVDAPDPPLHAALLLTLLRKAGHPAGGESSAETAVKPVHGDLLRYHLRLFRDEGVTARLSIVDAGTGKTLTLDSERVDASWTRYSLWAGYPMVLHSYTELHEVVRDHNLSDAAL